jgi:hypothetical protein
MLTTFQEVKSFYVSVPLPTLNSAKNVFSSLCVANPKSNAKPFNLLDGQLLYAQLEPS